MKLTKNWKELNWLHSVKEKKIIGLNKGKITTVKVK